MTRIARTSLRRFATRSTAVAGLLTATLLLSSPALADRGRHKHHPSHRHGVVRVHHVRPLPPPPARVRFVVPTVIRATHLETYRRYYRGHVHYAPHGHAHARYAFPLWYGGVVVSEPREYCRGALFLDSPAAPYASRFRLHIAF